MKANHAMGSASVRDASAPLPVAPDGDYTTITTSALELFGFTAEDIAAVAPQQRSTMRRFLRRAYEPSIPKWLGGLTPAIAPRRDGDENPLGLYREADMTGLPIYVRGEHTGDAVGDAIADVKASRRYAAHKGLNSRAVAKDDGRRWEAMSHTRSADGVVDIDGPAWFQASIDRMLRNSLLLLSAYAGKRCTITAGIKAKARREFILKARTDAPPNPGERNAAEAAARKAFKAAWKCPCNHCDIKREQSQVWRRFAAGTKQLKFNVAYGSDKPSRQAPEQLSPIEQALPGASASVLEHFVTGFTRSEIESAAMEIPKGSIALQSFLDRRDGESVTACVSRIAAGNGISAIGVHRARRSVREALKSLTDMD